jgi:hypothetical protein
MEKLILSLSSQRSEYIFIAILRQYPDIVRVRLMKIGT